MESSRKNGALIVVFVTLVSGIIALGARYLDLREAFGIRGQTVDLLRQGLSECDAQVQRDTAVLRSVNVVLETAAKKLEEERAACWTSRGDR